MFHVAAFTGKLSDKVKSLLSTSAESERITVQMMLQQQDTYGSTPGHIAVTYNQAEILKKMLIVFPRLLTVVNKYKETLLHIMAAQGYCCLIDIFKSFMECFNEALSMRDNVDCTPMLMAAKMGQLNVISKLADINPRLLGDITLKGETIVHVAALNHRTDIVSYMQKLSLFNQADKDGNNILHCAVMVRRKSSCIKNLIRLIDLIIKLSPHLLFSPNKRGDLPIHSANQAGSYFGIEVLGDYAPILYQQPDGAGRTLRETQGVNAHALVPYRG